MLWPWLVLVAVVPDRVEVQALESVGRVERGRKQDLPGGVRLREDDRDVFLLPATLSNRIPAAPARDIVLGIHVRLPREDEVLDGDRSTVAPHGVLLELEANRERAPLDDLRLTVCHVGRELEVGLQDVRSTKRRADRPRSPRIVAPGECPVQARRLLLGGEDDCSTALRRLRRSRRPTRDEEHAYEADDRQGRQTKSMHKGSSPFEFHRCIPVYTRRSPTLETRGDARS